MTTPSRTALLVLLASPIGFLAGAAWGVAFGFPSPDAGAEESARLQFHANLSGAIMVLSILVLAGSGLHLLGQWLIARERRRFSGFSTAA